MAKNGCGDGSTMERFVEMSLGLAMGQQMAQAMNNTLNAKPSKKTAEAQRLYYAAIEGRQAGPFSETEIVRLINDKKIARTTLVWRQGMTAWKAAQDVPEILRIITLGPPPLN